MSSFEQRLQQARERHAAARKQEAGESEGRQQVAARRADLAQGIGLTARRVMDAITRSGMQDSVQHHPAVRSAVYEEARRQAQRQVRGGSGPGLSGHGRVSPRRQQKNDERYARTFQEQLAGHLFTVWPLGTVYVWQTGPRDDPSYRSRTHLLGGAGELLWSEPWDPRHLGYSERPNSPNRSALGVEPYAPSMAGDAEQVVRELSIIEDGLANLVARYDLPLA